MGITKCQKMIDYYIENLKLDKNRIFILINKENKYSIDNKIIKNIFKDIKIIGRIKNSIEYERLINKKFKNLELILTKKQVKDLNKVIEEIV